MENRPRAVFERLVGDSTDPVERAARIRENRSILDLVSQDLKRLMRSVGESDRVKLDQYSDAVRSVEQQIQVAEQQSSTELPEHGEADRHTGNVFGLRQADDGSAGAGVSGRHDAGRHVHGRPRDGWPRIPGAGVRRPASFIDASPGRHGQDREGHPDQHVSCEAVPVFPGEAAARCPTATVRCSIIRCSSTAAR